MQFKHLQRKVLILIILREHHHGSIVATLYAIGYSAKEMYDFFKEYCNQINYIEVSTIPKFILSKILKNKVRVYGLNSGRIISKKIKEVANKKRIQNISDIDIPIYIPSVDLKTGSLIVFTSQNKRKDFSDNIIYINNVDISTAVRASCSFPGIFEPVKLGNFLLADGGIRENVPWHILKESNYNNIFSIVFGENNSEHHCNNIIDVITTSFDLICHELSNYELNGAEYLIKINTPHVSLLECSRIDELYILGYRQTKEFIQKNRLIFN